MTNIADILDADLNAVTGEIIAERRRQIEVEGWSPEHDDRHNKGDLALAAALYASPVELFAVEVVQPKPGSMGYGIFPSGTLTWSDPWPFKTKRHVRHDLDVEVNDGDGRKRHSRRRRLIIAAALIVAEIERLDRAAS